MADYDLQDEHAPSAKVLAIRRAAVAFANDYGPLPAANGGDPAAQHDVAARLVRALRRQGLHIERNLST